MHQRNRRFVVIALGYGLLGGLIGILRLAAPELIPGNAPRIHGHIMLLGFLLMLVYGVGLHVIPRFSGYPLRSERIANWQFYLANGGLPLMILGWLSLKNWLVLLGGTFAYAAIVLFGINMVLTVRTRGPAE